MQKQRTPNIGKIVWFVFWGIVAAITIVWLFSQQIKLNSENQENTNADKTLAERQEYWDEISSEDPSMTDEEIERVAREELNMKKPGEMVLVSE